MTAVGILGIGTHLPAQVRTNDYWSSDVVAAWGERMAARVTRADADHTDAMTEGARLTLRAMGEVAADPFRGAVERRVMDDATTVHEMEAAAARQAIERAGIEPNAIDVVLTQSPVPENLFVNSACVTHRLLGLRERCLAMGTEAACNAFAVHASLARGLIASNTARYVLSIHSSAMTRIMRRSEPDSAWWGDGATAVVFGPVSDGRGLLSSVHHADGASCDALVLGVQNRRWWEDGSISLTSLDRLHTRRMLLTLADRARDAIAASIAAAGLRPSDVGFYASHQGTAWLTNVTASHAGLAHAKTITTFPSFGNLNSANIPLILAIAEREHVLRDGDVVTTFSGGVGETWSSLCLRWGR
ncbi:MAG TPA: 3-oxoacyl-[acyl-carrier-protein] synthase III C-terminal domain-containing protein [Kofleriaceae bacterium]|nr:3-oxoacyl-[acyl-carrier-protein] synthase III C-terminal domain-containing protein [Kofleriaceae bacterium]